MAESTSGSEPSEGRTPLADGCPSSGVTDDDEIILWMLSLSPTERLDVAQGFVDSIEALRKGRRDQIP